MTFSLLLRLLVIIFLVVGPAMVGNAAVVTEVDTTGGSHNSIAVDISGHAHISYAADGSFHFNPVNSLKYATNVAGSWIIETVDNADDVGGYSSIVLDSAGRAHISYYDYTSGNLKYATNASGSWTITVLDSSGSVGRFTAIAADASDNLHISYYDDTNGTLKYATNTSGTWVNASIGPNNCAGFTSIALDPSDHVYITCIASNDLRLYTNTAGTWDSEIIENDVADSSNSGMYTAVAADAAGDIHIAYMDKSQGSLKYAINTTGSWVITEVETINGITGEYVALALDSLNKAHISYSNFTEPSVRYATNRSGTWVITHVENYANDNLYPWRYTAIAVDLSDTVHMSFFQEIYQAEKLKYAAFNPPAYDAAGTWNYSEFNNWASSGCIPDSDESSTVIVTQTGNSVTLDLNNDTWTGCVSGWEYHFYISFFEGGWKTTYITDFSLSSPTAGSGEISWQQDNGCEGGKDLSLTLQGIQSSVPSSSSSSGGGGGGGCFVSTSLE
jgi:hypothetical protein